MTRTTIILYLSSIFCLVSTALFAQLNTDLELLLYDSLEGNAEQHIYNDKSELTHVHGEVIPRLLVYQADEPNGTSILICPGGGYSKLNVRNTEFTAHRLNDLGITAFVLVYSLPDSEAGINTFQAVADVDRALTIIHEYSTKLNLDTGKIGLLGSSAGGHLASTVVTLGSAKRGYSEYDFTDKFHFLVLTFPVISMGDSITHVGSRNNLIGKEFTSDEGAWYSSHLWVDNQLPATFIVHGSSDPSVSVQNSTLFLNALLRNNVPVEFHAYQINKHGFGLDPAQPNTWFTQLTAWLERNDFI